MSHKLAAFNSMVYRMCKLPLSIKNYMNELKLIKEIANTNGYTENEIDNLVSKHSKNIKKHSLSTLFKQEAKAKQKSITRAPFKFTHMITNNLKPIYKAHKMEIVYANNDKLKNILGNPKDKCDGHQKSGIYKILCDFCPRFLEHRRHIKYNRPAKSAVAEHALNNLHVNITETSIQNLKLIRTARSIKQLDVLESIEIHKNKTKLMNNEYGPISSPLFNFIKPVP